MLNRTVGGGRTGRRHPPRGSQHEARAAALRRRASAQQARRLPQASQKPSDISSGLSSKRRGDDAGVSKSYMSVEAQNFARFIIRGPCSATTILSLPRCGYSPASPPTSARRHGRQDRRRARDGLRKRRMNFADRPTLPELRRAKTRPEGQWRSCAVSADPCPLASRPSGRCCVIPIAPPLMNAERRAARRCPRI